MKRGSYTSGRYVELIAQRPRLHRGWLFEEQRASLHLGLRVDDEPLLELTLSFDGKRFATGLDWLLPDRRRDGNTKGWCRRQPADYHAEVLQ